RRRGARVHARWHTVAGNEGCPAVAGKVGADRDDRVEFFLAGFTGFDRQLRHVGNAVAAARADGAMAIREHGFAGGQGHLVLGPVDAVALAIRDVDGTRARDDGLLGLGDVEGGIVGSGDVVVLD